MLVVTDETIGQLEELLINEFDRFQGLFRRQYGREVFDADWSHIDPIWTCYINGHGQGYRGQEWGWKGVFDKWARQYLFRGKRIDVISESWYRVDEVVVEFEDYDWWSGSYKLLLAFEQENDPEEIRAHTRQFYDLNIPEKVLLIWTNKANPSSKEILTQTKEVIAHCQRGGIRNCGQTTVIVGDFDGFAESYRTRKSPKMPLLLSQVIPSEIG